MTCYLADYPLRGENKKCLSAEAEPCESVLSSIIGTYLIYIYIYKDDEYDFRI